MIDQFLGVEYRSYAIFSIDRDEEEVTIRMSYRRNQMVRCHSEEPHVRTGKKTARMELGGQYCVSSTTSSRDFSHDEQIKTPLHFVYFHLAWLHYVSLLSSETNFEIVHALFLSTSAAILPLIYWSVFAVFIDHWAAFTHSHRRSA